MDVAGSVFSALHICSAFFATSTLASGLVYCGRCVKWRASGVTLMRWDVMLISLRCPSHKLSNFFRICRRRFICPSETKVDLRLATKGFFSLDQKSDWGLSFSGDSSSIAPSILSPLSCEGMVCLECGTTDAIFSFMTGYWGIFLIFAAKIWNCTFSLKQTAPWADKIEVFAVE